MTSILSQVKVLVQYKCSTRKSTRFYHYFDKKTEGKHKKSQTKDEILYILLAFVLYPAIMYVGNNYTHTYTYISLGTLVSLSTIVLNSRDQ